MNWSKIWAAIGIKPPQPELMGTRQFQGATYKLWQEVAPKDADYSGMFYTHLYHWRKESGEIVGPTYHSFSTADYHFGEWWTISASVPDKTLISVYTEKVEIDARPRGGMTMERMI